MNDQLLFQPDTAKSQAIPYLVKEFCRLFENWIEYAKGIVPPEEMQALIFQLHYHLIQKLHQELREQETVKERICRYVLQNLPNGPTVKGLANELGYSTKYCSKMVIANLGEPFSAYVKRIRLDEAKEHLAAGNASIAAVAGFVGFQDQFAFSHFFKKAVGISPQEYRKRQTSLSQWPPRVPPHDKSEKSADILRLAHRTPFKDQSTRGGQVDHPADPITRVAGRQQRQEGRGQGESASDAIPPPPYGGFR
ncbi:MAG: AraC family transcriptional regulator [Nitrospirales bacterium]